MSKYIKASTKAGLGLRLCWRNGVVESIVLEDTAPKASASRHSDGVHVRLHVQVIPTARWDYFDEAPYLKAVEDAKASGVQSRLDKAMKELGAAVKQLAADGAVTVADSATQWALQQQPLEHYLGVLRGQRRTPKSLIALLQDQAESARVCFRDKDWTKLENQLLLGLGLKPLRSSKKVEDDEQKDSLELGELDELASF